MHLIYVRFYTKFLRDLGLLNFDEPAIKMFNQGMIQGADGNKMSKSKGNTVDVTEIVDKYGADALRMYLVSVAGPESDFNWKDLLKALKDQQCKGYMICNSPNLEEDAKMLKDYYMAI